MDLYRKFRSAGRVILQVSAVVGLACGNGCSVISQEGVHSVSIAPDDQSFVINYQRGSESLLAVIATDGYVPTILLQPQQGIRFDRPRFSRDGEKVFFIRRRKRDQGDLHVIDIDGTDLARVTDGQEGTENIQDFALSRDGGTIYFINSGFFGHYSPIAASRPHNMDFYSIDASGAGLERLSHRNSYVLYGISVSPKGDSLYSRAEILALTTPREFRHFSYRSNYQHAFTSQYPLSEITDDGLVVLSCAKVQRSKPGYNSREKHDLGDGWAVYGFGLYLIDIDEQVVIDEIVHLPSYLDSPALFHDQQRVLFVRNDSVYGGEAGRELWSVNIDGSNLHRIVSEHLGELE